ncbi:unnamed protein product [Adineta steineri]|uniref:Ig-like domain-containing protein n=1 Tax=Adineta steineri TaxID=433720 RepID=A0A819H483_9BILA|nr:unnamed protein product [Adineta steineri]CAF3891353.1 unnamed protein product [Adineta steineri]
MEYKQQITLIGQTFVCLLFFIVYFSGISANIEPEIISTQDEIITYINHTAKLSCIIQNRNRQHVTWSRVNIINETRKITDLLYVDLLKYTPFTRYHLTHLIEKDNQEYWNLEIRQVHLADQGYYSCVVTALKPISKIFYIKVIENTRNLSLALRSTLEMQQQDKQEIIPSSSSSSSSLIGTSLSMMLLRIILILII